ncbi:MAG: hypothetical protein AAF514_07810 [Verrucomicrobiota bacterium]
MIVVLNENTLPRISDHRIGRNDVVYSTADNHSDFVISDLIALNEVGSCQVSSVGSATQLHGNEFTDNPIAQLRLHYVTDHVVGTSQDENPPLSVAAGRIGQRGISERVPQTNALGHLGTLKYDSAPRIPRNKVSFASVTPADLDFSRVAGHVNAVADLSRATSQKSFLPAVRNDRIVGKDPDPIPIDYYAIGVQDADPVEGVACDDVSFYHNLA